MNTFVRAMLITLLGVIVAGNALSAEDSRGTIDWTGGYVVATGFGTAGAGESIGKARLNALRAAEVSAQRALLETIKGVRLNSQTTVHNMMLEEDIITTRVDGFLKGAVVTKKSVEFVDGAPVATVEMRVCLTAGDPECASKPTLIGVLDIERRREPLYVPVARYPMTPPPAPPSPPAPPVTPLPPAVDPAPPVQPVVAPPVVVPPPVQPPVQAVVAPPVIVPPPVQPPVTVVAPPKVDVPPPPPAVPVQTNIEPLYDPSKPVTGLVLSLDGRYYEREVLPVIITNASGSFQTVYSVKSVNPGIIRTYGAVRYADTLENARKVQTIGTNPIVVFVNDVTRENMIIIRSKDAALIRETIYNGNNYLGDAKVVISVR